MRRNTRNLARLRYDLTIIGGGIYGAFVAWDAASRGLSVALVDKGDFGHATSSNNLRVIHGGLRYLQHGDIRRMRESIRERTVLMRVAPHLVHPMPFLMPTYGHSFNGKEVMTAALLINDLIGFDRNDLADPQKHLPRGRIVSRSECLRLAPGLDVSGLTGGAIWYDCQMYSSERLVLSVLRAAERAGAQLANYVEVTGFLVKKDQVTGIKVRDLRTGDCFDIGSTVVVNTSGPWLDPILRRLNPSSRMCRVPLSKAMNIVVNRQLFGRYAVGVRNSREFTDSDAIVNKGSRLFFITPWHKHSLIGTTHEFFDGHPDHFRVSEHDIESFIAEINSAYPAASLKRSDISFFYGGLLPSNGNRSLGNVTLLKHCRIFDHAREERVDGLVSVVGVKFTTARDVAERVVNIAFTKLGKKPPKCRTAETPIYGGRIERFEDFRRAEECKSQGSVGSGGIRHLTHNYGDAYPEVIRYVVEDPKLGETVSSSAPVIKAEIIHGIEQEMALTLSDIVMRRTELGCTGYPGDSCVNACASLMAEHLGWSKSRMEDEIQQLRDVFHASV